MSTTTQPTIRHDDIDAALEASKIVVWEHDPDIGVWVESEVYDIHGVRLDEHPVDVDGFPLHIVWRITTLDWWTDDVYGEVVQVALLQSFDGTSSNRDEPLTTEIVAVDGAALAEDFSRTADLEVSIPGFLARVHGVEAVTETRTTVMSPVDLSAFWDEANDALHGLVL